RNRKKTRPEIASDRWDSEQLGPLDLAGETALMIHRLIVPLTLTALVFQAGSALAQGAFPAPLPNQAAPMPKQPGTMANDPAFPPVNGVRSASVGTAAPASASPFPTGGAAPLAGGPRCLATAPPTHARRGPAAGLLDS